MQRIWTPILLVLLVASCGSSEAVPPPTPMLTSTLTPLPPSTSTPTSIPTSTPTPTPTPIPTATPTSTPTPTPPAMLGLRLDWDDPLVGWEHRWALRGRMQEEEVNWVGLGAGRIDWVFFPWPEHEGWWSSSVRTTGRDLLAEQAAFFGELGPVVAVVDVMAPRYLVAHPDEAAVSAWGEPSQEFVSTAALVEGNFGRVLLAMLDHVAANYPVAAIGLTELFYDDYGYGADDLALYTAFTGHDDWPRQGGQIDTRDPALSRWRAEALAGWLARAAETVHAHGVDLWVDVQVSWDDLAREGAEHGHNYRLFLEATDRLVVWAYFPLAGEPPQAVKRLAEYLVTHYGAEQIILSLGLWGPDGSVMPANDLRQALVETRRAGLADVWITPSHLMTGDHWEALKTQ